MDCFVWLAPRVKLSNHTAGALTREGSGVGQSVREGLFALPPPEHLANRFFNRLAGVIQQEGVLCRLEGRDGPGRIPQVTRFQVGAKSGDCSRNSL